MIEHLSDTEKLQFMRKAKLLEKKAMELIEFEDYERAGLLFGWAGYAYVQLQEWEDAGYSYGQSGESYKRTGNWSKAGFSYNLSGSIYERAEKWLGAGLNYTLSGYAYEQSKEYEKAGESYRKAGEAYRETGKWQEVALSYQQSGEACKTAKAWRSAGLSFAQSGNAYKKAMMWIEAEENYCKAKMAYTEAGAYEDAGCMYYLEMLMKRMRMRKYSLKHFISYMYDLICGYGEKPKNIIFWCLGLVLLFSIIYTVFDGLVYRGASAISNSLLAKFFHSLYFSMMTFTTLGLGDFEPVIYMRPLVMLESFLGIFMIVLLVLVLGRKMIKH